MSYHFPALLSQVNEMRMWMCGVTPKDKIRNEFIREITRLAKASEKITQRPLKWYGYLMRRKRTHSEESAEDVSTKTKKVRMTENKMERHVPMIDVRKVPD